jgi:hypothetical protein
MSLINDALRRAKQQTVPAPTVAELPLRPLEPGVEKHSRPLALPLMIMFVGGLIVAGALVPLMSSRESVREKPHAPASTVMPAPAPVVDAVTPITVPAAAVVVVTNEPLTVTPAPQVTEAVLPLSPVRLQGILYHSSAPSAIINGKTVRAGDRVGDYAVLSISRSSAILATATQTNILHIEE